MPDHELDLKNAAYWNELCGTNLATSLGISDASERSLKRFDDWYMDYYPYLSNHIPFDRLAGKDVLEVGLGYGTVAQRLAENGANYFGLDVAQGPVNMVNLRLERLGLMPTASVGNILEPPYEPESFDAIVAIGCLHHTGDLPLAIERCRRVLRPGGELIFMVYYTFSYRRWASTPFRTSSRAISELFGARGVVGSKVDSDRAAYDSDGSGDAAPHTDWISKRSPRHLCRNFSRVKMKTENINKEFPFPNTNRNKFLNTSIPKYCGLDLYASAEK